MIWLSFKDSQTMQVIAPECIEFMMIYYFIKGLMSLQDIINAGLLYVQWRQARGCFIFRFIF